MSNKFIRKCTCKHEFQDKRYGKGYRVMTPVRGDNRGNITYRCTVCVKEQD